jgi:hypothetical protein
LVQSSPSVKLLEAENITAVPEAATAAYSPLFLDTYRVQFLEVHDLEAVSSIIKRRRNL